MSFNIFWLTPIRSTGFLLNSVRFKTIKHFPGVVEASSKGHISWQTHSHLHLKVGVSTSPYMHVFGVLFCTKYWSNARQVDETPPWLVSRWKQHHLMIPNGICPSYKFLNPVLKSRWWIQTGCIILWHSTLNCVCLFFCYFLELWQRVLSWLVLLLRKCVMTYVNKAFTSQ